VTAFVPFFLRVHNTLVQLTNQSTMHFKKGGTLETRSKQSVTDRLGRYVLQQYKAHENFEKGQISFLSSLIFNALHVAKEM